MTAELRSRMYFLKGLLEAGQIFLDTSSVKLRNDQKFNDRTRPKINITKMYVINLIDPIIPF